MNLLLILLRKSSKLKRTFTSSSTLCHDAYILYCLSYYMHVCAAIKANASTVYHLFFLKDISLVPHTLTHTLTVVSPWPFNLSTSAYNKLLFLLNSTSLFYYYPIFLFLQKNCLKYLPELPVSNFHPIVSFDFLPISFHRCPIHQCMLLN